MRLLTVTNISILIPNAVRESKSKKVVRIQSFSAFYLQILLSVAVDITVDPPCCQSRPVKVTSEIRPVNITQKRLDISLAYIKNEYALDPITGKIRLELVASGRLVRMEKNWNFADNAPVTMGNRHRTYRQVRCMVGSKSGQRCLSTNVQIMLKNIGEAAAEIEPGISMLSS